MARRDSRGRVIDSKLWAKVPGFSANLSADGIQGGSRMDFTAPLTILRICGSHFCELDATMQVGDQMVVTYAIGIVSTDAAVLGATAIPDPFDEYEYSWLYLREVHLHAQKAAAVDAWGPAAQWFDLDTKAMRKVKPGQSLIWYTQLSGATGAPVTFVQGSALRVLLGLH